MNVINFYKKFYVKISTYTRVLIFFCYFHQLHYQFKFSSTEKLKRDFRGYNFRGYSSVNLIITFIIVLKIFQDGIFILCFKQ